MSSSRVRITRSSTCTMLTLRLPFGRQCIPRVHPLEVQAMLHFQLVHVAISSMLDMVTCTSSLIVPTLPKHSVPIVTCLTTRVTMPLCTCLLTRLGTILTQLKLVSTTAAQAMEMETGSTTPTRGRLLWQCTT